MAIDTTELGLRPDLRAMELWTAWVTKLMNGAVEQASDAGERRTLAGAADDAASLRDALAAASTGWLEPDQTEVLHSIYALWEANLSRFERLAASVDPAGYQRWLGRSASARPRLEHALV